ncbi:hypothetical protein [Nocardioides sp. GY 10127]|uniref:hypothetical protein n=1 Tax=Nocardioides sp. GY 10127 TaxID=2569762 RepID=UPI0010A77FEA|nr:hypothetical protein [Nocardioides sp. GY 10127]TIC81690.1 hypothetical protein E8D37_10870 [Nocardioides sp. GY 10127]
MSEDATGEQPAGKWDEVAQGLGELRRRQGDPSYAEIARLVSEQRLADGASPAASRVARSTVFDCFKTGRTRINLPLVREIARALGADTEVVDGWVLESLQRSSGRTLPPTEPAAAPHAEAAGAREAVEREPGSVATEEHGAVPIAAPAASTAPLAPAEPAALLDEKPPFVPVWQILVAMVLCLLIDLMGRYLTTVSHLPLHLDMVGTATAAMLLGPWRGAAVGAAMNVAGVLSIEDSLDWVSLAFAGVNVLGGLVWGFGIHRWGWGRTLPRLLGLSLVVAVLCSAQAVPILLIFFHSGMQPGTDFVIEAVYERVPRLDVALAIANLIVSVADKMISTFVGLSLAALAPRAMRWRLERQVPLVRS